MQICETVNMQKSPTQLTHLNETHAEVWYMGYTDDHCFEGWVWIDHRDSNQVVARKLRGRNNFRLCKVTDILSVKAVTS